MGPPLIINENKSDYDNIKEELAQFLRILTKIRTRNKEHFKAEMWGSDFFLFERISGGRLLR